MWMLIIVPALIIADWCAYLFASEPQSRRLRRRAFGIALALYYGLLIAGYYRDAAYYDGRMQCGMWTIGYWFAGFAGLAMPLIHWIFSALAARRMRRAKRIL